MGSEMCIRDRKNEISQHQERKREDSTQGEYYFIHVRKERGGVAPRRNSRITESATKESREANMKYVEGG